MNHPRFSHRLVLIVCLLAASSLFLSCSLFSQKKPPAAITHITNTREKVASISVQMEERVIRSALVNVDFTLLSVINSDSSGLERSLTIPVFDNQELILDLDAPLTLPSGEVIQTGSVRGQPGSGVTVVVNGTTLAMDIHAVEGIFQIHYNGSVHELLQLDLPGIPDFTEEDVFPKMALSSLDQPQATIYPIDVMVLFSPQAASAAGGIQNLQNQINLAAAQTNQGFTNSGVDIHLTIVAMVETSTEPASYSDALYCIKETADGCLDGIHALRDAYYADLVLYVLNNNTYCGLSWLNTTFNEYAHTTAFGTVNWRCMTGYYGFAKEIGHLMGAQIDRAAAVFRQGAFPYSYGYQAPNQNFRTIMAYDCPNGCPRINYWSNPDVIYNGQPTGVLYTDGNAADNRRTLNTTAPFVSNYRVPPSPPAQATIISPSNGASLIETAPVFTWNPLYDSPEFIIEVRLRSNSTLVAQSQLPALEVCTDSTCSYQFDQEFAPEDYRWRVAGQNSIGTGPWSIANNFSIRMPAPLLISPDGNVRVFNPQPILRWQHNSLAQTYEIQVRNSGNTIIHLSQETASVLCTDDICQFQLPQPLLDGEYRWFVRGWMTVGGIWSPAAAFTKATLPSPEIINPPAYGTLYNNRIEYRWRPVSLAQTYNLQLTNLDSGQIDNYQISAAEACAELPCRFWPGAPLPIAHYEWRINAQISAFPGEWSPRTPFQVLSIPPVSLVSPSYDSMMIDQAPTLVWNQLPIDELRAYQIHIRDVQTNTLVYSQLHDISLCSEDTCSHPVSENLPDGQYKWHIRAVAGSNFGQWSPYWAYTQAYTPGTTNLLFPQNDRIIYGGRPTFRWSVVPNATSYQMQLLQSDAIIGDWTVGTDVCTSDQCEYRIPLILTQFDTYQWKIRADRHEIQGDWSDTFIFHYTQLSIPAMVSPTNNSSAENSSPEFVWQTVPGATFYQFQLKTNDDVLVYNVLAPQGSLCGIEACVLTYPTNLPAGEYKWHVRARNGGNYSRWSPYWNLTVTAAPSHEFDFDGTAPGWVDPFGRWSFFNDRAYRGQPGESTHLSAVTYYDVAFENAAFTSHARSVGVNGSNGFSLILRATFDESGRLQQGYTIDIQGSANGITISGWYNTAGSSSTPTNALIMPAASVSGIDISLYNTYDLVVQGNQANVFVNGTQVYTMTMDPVVTSGHFGYDVISANSAGHSVDIAWAKIIP